MAGGNSRGISTSQVGVHDKLDELVVKYQNSENKRPISVHTQAAFEKTCEWLEGFDGDVILDSCCGVGESTANIARANPEARVIGIDKSELRVEKHEHYRTELSNYTVIRADVNDFWRLAVADGWQPTHHYILYPNPWPKATHFKRRWHGAPVFPYLLMLGGQLQMRSNFPLYLQEFQRALEVAGLA